MTSFLFDVRFALRNLARRPGFTAVAILTLTLGIGAVTAIFSLTNGVLLEPPPFDDPESLVVVWETNAERSLPKMFASPPTVADWERENDTLVGLAAFTAQTSFLSGDAGLLEVRSVATTRGLFEVLGVEPLLGRGFTWEEDRPGAEPVVVLGHDLWRRQLGGDPAAVGRSVVLDGQPRRVVGVMPAGFSFPPPLALEGTPPPDKADLWVPLGVDLPSGQRGAHFLTVVARLRDGVPRPAAEADLQAVAAGIAQASAGTYEGWSVAVSPLSDEMLGRIEPALWLLMGAVASLLLIACANLANLLLAQGRDRERELSVRHSLGASNGRLAGQLVTEGLVLALAGGASGLFLAWATLRGLVSLAPANVPRLDEVEIDLRVVAFAAAVSVLTGLLFSALPAVRCALGERRGEWRSGSFRATLDPESSRAGAILVVAEVALAFVLLVGAGLFGRSFLELRGVEPGFRADRVLTARVTTPAARFQEDRQVVAQDFRRFEEALAALPGVEGAGFVLELPLDADRQGTSASIEGREGPASPEAGHANFTFVTPGYFPAMGVPLLAGRWPEPADGPGSEPVVLVSEAFVRRFLPEVEELSAALDQRILLSFQSQVVRRIVGVVGSVRHDSLAREPFPSVYVPYYQLPWDRSLALSVRTSLPPEAAARAVRERLLELDPEVAVHRVQTLEQVVSSAVAGPRFTGLLMTAFAVAALSLAAVGVYGVLAFSVRRRTREIGVRIALGAAGRDILRLVVGRWMGLVALGIGIGLGAALVLAKPVESLLFRVDPTEPEHLLMQAGFLAAVALAACYLPARRALEVDPRITIEAE